MIKFEIDTAQMQAFAKGLGATQKDIERVGFDVAKKTGEDIVKVMQVQPPKPTGYKMTFKSDRQRKFFFAALRSGQITVPYVRTYTLKRGWNVRVRASGNTTAIMITNTVPYAGWVQGAGTQARIHAGRWQTLDDSKVKQLLSRMPKEVGSRLAKAWRSKRF